MSEPFAAKADKFSIKDSGERKQFASGMVRDVTTGKIDWSLVADGPMLKRYAEHLTKGAEKYEARNWMKAVGVEEYNRFRESAFRHFMSWWYDELDEDHAAAVFFNINGAERLRAHLDEATAFATRNVVGAAFNNRLIDGGPTPLPAMPTLRKAKVDFGYYDAEPTRGGWG